MEKLSENLPVAFSLRMISLFKSAGDSSTTFAFDFVVIEFVGIEILKISQLEFERTLYLEFLPNK